MPIPSETTLSFVREHRLDNVRALALQAHKYADVDMPAALTQIAGWQIARQKVPAWAAAEGVCYPPHLSMEQCSSEETARYKQELIKSVAANPTSPSEEYSSFADLTGGFGIDCSFLSSLFEKAAFVERQSILCHLAKHNFPLLGLKHITVCHADAVEYLNTMQPVDWIFIDPARRDNQGGKTVAISDCEPDVSLLEPLLLQKAKHVLVKLSPMLDLSLALNDMRHVQQAHIVSVGNECKELLLVLGNDMPQTPHEVPIHCINLLPGGEVHSLVFTRRQERDSACSYTDTPKTYLYEPNASILKAGAFRILTHTYKVEKLHPNSHLYTSDEYLPHFPGRKFRIDARCGFGKKEVKTLLGTERKANLTVRNFPATVADLRKRLHLSEGGDTYLFATTLNNEKRVILLCKSIQK